MPLLDTDGGNHRCPHCGAIECDIHLDQTPLDTLNQYGLVATHEDCNEREWSKTPCFGMLGYWENPNTGNKRLLCAEHMDQAERRQNAIQREYLNDTTTHLGDY